MAKKKPASPDAKPKAVKKTAAVSETDTMETGETSSDKAASRTLTHDEIGVVAGLVWQLLNEQGEQSLASIKSSVDAPSDLILAAIGWLAREDKLLFASKARSIALSLR
jgi:hypothetical protein